MDPTPEQPPCSGSIAAGEAQPDSPKALGTHDGPSPRTSITVLDLPNELMLKVLHFVRYLGEEIATGSSVADDHSGDIESIKNARLTCRRFCSTSSHQLIHRLHITLAPASLAHLDEVSRHPTISKGIYTLRVNAGLYVSALAADILPFATMSRTKLARDVRILGYRRNSSDSQEQSEVIEKAERVLKSWSSFIETQQEPDDETGRLDVAALRQGHERYRQLHREQEGVLRDDNFAEAIAAAVARMAMATRLIMTDRETPRRLADFRAKKPKSTWEDRVESPGLWLDDEMCLPCTWRDEMLGLEQPPTRLLYQVPLAFSRAGTSLVYLQINIMPPARFDFTLDEEQRAEYMAATQNLNIYGFIGWPDSREAERPERDPQDTTRLMNFLAIPLASSKAEIVNLIFTFLRSVQDSVHRSIVASALSPFALEFSPAVRGYYRRKNKAKSAVCK